MKNLILIFLMAITFSSCSPAYSSGGWFIPFLLMSGSIYFGRKWKKDRELVNGLVSIALLAATIVVVILMNHDK